MSGDAYGGSRVHAYRMILAALDRTDAGRDAFDTVLAEFDADPRARRLVMMLLTQFAAARVISSPTPERWERWLADRIGELLDAAARDEAGR
jgi:hypothetical protein